MAAFLLSMKGQKPTTQAIRDHVFVSKQLGRLDSAHFMAELLPLPRASHHSINGYESVWSSVKAYKNEVIPKRFKLITNTIKANPDVKLLVSYDKSFTAEALGYYPSELAREWRDARGKIYSLYNLTLGTDRRVSLLVTPFFGQGQPNYEGLAHAAAEVVALLYSPFTRRYAHGTKI